MQHKVDFNLAPPPPKNMQKDIFSEEDLSAEDLAKIDVLAASAVHYVQQRLSNPFLDEEMKRVCLKEEKPPEDIRMILKRKVDPAEISTRPGPGGVLLHYIAASDVINKMNEIFGYNNWTTQIMEEERVSVEQLENSNKWQVIIRVKLRLCVINKQGEKTIATYREDVGWATSVGSKGDALENASKAATSDALKRCARQLGDALGNCLYNKKFLNELKMQKK
jgi:DNA repair and recombination protein RAD52